MAARRLADSLLTFALILLVVCAMLAMLPNLKRMAGAGRQPSANEGGLSSQKPASHAIAADDYIAVDGLWLRDGRGRPHFVQGMNYWSCMNLGASDEAGGDIRRLAMELDQLAAVGINHLRVVAASEGSAKRAPFRILPALQHLPGQWDERIFAGLDRCVAEAGKRGMRLTLVMGNTWQWTGGNAQVYA